jgi:hypothetical protein
MKITECADFTAICPHCDKEIDVVYFDGAIMRTSTDGCNIRL